MVFSNLQSKIYLWSREYGQKIGLDLPYFIKNGSWMALKQAVELITAIAPLVVFSRLVDPAIFGEYQYFLSILAIMSIVSLPGLNVSVLRSVSRGYDGDYQKAVRMSFLWSLIGVPSLFLLGVYYFLVDRSGLGISLMISSIFFPFFYAPNTWNYFLQGKEKYNILLRFFSVQAAFNALSIICIALYNSSNLILIATVYLASFTTFNCLYYWKSLRYVKNGKQSQEGMRYGHFLTRMNVFQIVADNIDKIILGVMLAPQAVAAFGIISLIPVKTRTIFKSVISVIFPKISRDDFIFSEFYRKKKKIVFSFLAFDLLIGIIYFLLIEKVSGIIFGSTYVDYYGYAKVFSIFVVIALPTVFLSWYAQAKKKTSVIIAANPIYLAFKLTFTITLVYFFGIVGCIWAFNLNALLLFSIYLWLLRRPSRVAIQD